MNQDWPLMSGLDLGPLPSAARSARFHVKLVLLHWGLAALSETAELLVSELVTNALKASQALAGPVPSPVKLRVASDYERLVLAVWDGSTSPPVGALPDLMAESGRGLLLVEALAAKWDWYATPQYGGKVVWAELHAAPTNG